MASGSNGRRRLGKGFSAVAVALLCVHRHGMLAFSQAQSRASSSATAPTYTHYGINTYSLEIGGQKLLVDPLLVGDLVFWEQRWAFVGTPREAPSEMPRIKPKDVSKSFNAIILSQGLADHTHIPTLKAIDKTVPVIAGPSAAGQVKELGFADISTLSPGDKLNLGQFLAISVVPGSVVGPPWQEPENGYIFRDLRQGGLSIGMEPHGNFLGPLLGTSFRRFPQRPSDRIDALIMPLKKQTIAGYPLVNGMQEAVGTLEALDPVPRYVIPLQNGELNTNGALASALEEEGSPDEFEKILRSRMSLRDVQLLRPARGRPLTIDGK